MRAIEAAAGLAYWMGDLLTARRRYQETLAISQQSGDRAGEANALYNMSLTYLFMSSRDLAKGGEAAQGALERFKGVGVTAPVRPGPSGRFPTGLRRRRSRTVLPGRAISASRRSDSSSSSTIHS